MMQTALLSVATTVTSGIARQVAERSNANAANKDKAVSEPASAPGLKKSFRQAMAQAQANTSTAPCEQAAATHTTDQTTGKVIDKTTEIATESSNDATITDPALAGMLSPALQALVDSLPRPQSNANMNAAKPGTPSALINTLPSVADLPADAAYLAQPDSTGMAANTPRLSAKDATTRTAASGFTLKDLTGDAALLAADTAANAASATATATATAAITTAATHSIAAQHSPSVEALFNATALVTPHPSATSPAAATPITTRFGSGEWDKAFGQQLVWMSKNSSEGSSQSASLSLNPPELGPIKIVLHVSESQAYASFSSAQAEVRQAIEHAMPRLREMLGESGLELAQADINSGNPQQQGDRASHHSPHSPHALQTADAVAASQQTADTDQQAQRSVNVSTTSGSVLVDIFA